MSNRFWQREVGGWEKQKGRLRGMPKQRGQALVELALAISFIALLFAAAVDMGLAYKTYQTLVNATAEAASYLDQAPAVDCAAVGMAGSDPIACADALARERFRREQGDQMRGVANTADLNADGTNDTTGNNYDITQAIRIDEADNRQIDTANNQIASNYDPNAADAQCKKRIGRPTDTGGNGVVSCYIVIRSQIVYRPFVLSIAVGPSMTIRTISVRKVVSSN